MKSILVILLLTFFAVGAHGENAVILTQKDAPLVITSYTTAFEKENHGDYDSHSDQILHALKYKNTGEKKIVAIRIGLTAFDTFNDFMDRFGGVSIEDIAPGAEEKGEWTQSPYAAFLFQKYGTGVAYVANVRFEDGTIWNANLDEVLEQLRKFQKDLQAKDLQEKKQ